MFFNALLLVASSLLCTAGAIDYYIIPNGEHSNDNNTHELNYYLRNKNKYFASNNQLNFKPERYHLENNFTLDNVSNFTINGHGASMICHPQVGVTFINITGMRLECLTFINCTKDFRKHLVLNSYDHSEDNIFTSKNHSLQASILFDSCSFEVRNISLLCSAGVNGLMIVNVMATVNLHDVTVLMKFEGSSNSSFISSAIFLQFCMNSTVKNVSVYLKKIKFNLLNGYYSHRDYKDFSFAVIKVLLLESNFAVNLRVADIIFANLHNSMALYYYAKLHKFYSQNLSLDRIQAYNNTANMQLPLFYIIFHGSGFDFKSFQECTLKSYFTLHNSIINGNMNITPIIYVKLKKTLLTSTNITIYRCTVFGNTNTSFVLTSSESNSLLLLTHTIKLNHVNITNNINNLEGVSLLSFERGHVKLEGPVIIKENWYYENIISLYFAALRLHGNISISNNTGYVLINTLENSYFVLEENVRVEILSNIFHSALRKTDWIDNLDFYDNKKVCLAQFYSERGNLDYEFAASGGKYINYTVLVNSNKFTQPYYLARYDLGLRSNCSWLDSMAFKTTPSIQVKKAFVQSNITHSTKTDVFAVPSKVCYCTSNNTHNCTKHDVGPVYPGQLLKLPLIIPSLNLPTFHHYIMLTARKPNVSKSACIIENASEISQLHASHGCNEYKYTIKYNYFNECELYLRTQQHDTEIVYVKLKPCPAGFALKRGICTCDPLLESEPVLVASCHLDNETILRPENSWIAAKTNAIDYSHTYHVSLCCPFHYCLPYPSHLKLSIPDSQCQFNRAGVLCAQCQEGLSAVFGSFHCKKCSNLYLLIMIPFFIVILLLLVLLFMFNLTITNGAINLFILYIDIISINTSIYFQQCNSVLCMFAPLNEIETCFYNGMNNYHKMWLFLSYPLYIILIALLLIIASRYSVMFQRLTAQRALPVLATLFLLSFTGLLRTVSVVLFYFKTVTHLPGKHTTLVWVIDTSITLHGPKFIFLYIACLIFFAILLIFTVLLLFTKELLQFKAINKIKPLLDVYLGPYKHGFSYWTGLQLLMRIAIFGLTAIDNDLNLMISIMLLTVLLCIQGIVLPFKSKFQNFLQSVVLLNIVAINVIALYNREHKSQGFTAISILIYALSYYFIAYVIYHCIMHAFGKTISRGKTVITTCFVSWKQKLMSKKKLTEIMRMESLRDKIADVTYNYQEFQEPLIEID